VRDEGLVSQQSIRLSSTYGNMVGTGSFVGSYVVGSLVGSYVVGCILYKHKRKDTY